MRLPGLISKTETCFGKDPLPAPVPLRNFRYWVSHTLYIFLAIHLIQTPHGEEIPFMLLGSTFLVLFTSNEHKTSSWFLKNIHLCSFPKGVTQKVVRSASGHNNIFLSLDR